MRFKRLRLLFSVVTISVLCAAGAQSAPAQAPAPPAQTLAQNPASVLISLDDAIQMALRHNHNILAARTTIQQSEAEEITANLRPNPVILSDWQFLPIFQPSQFSADYLDNTAQFDLGVSYLFERGKKRQHRLRAARDNTAETRSQVADSERGLAFNVGSGFINVELAESTLALAREDLQSFQNTVDISEARYKAGDIGEGDLLKIKLQMLQFQTDVSAAQLARVQGLSDLRQLLGYESIPPDYDVAGAFDYQPVKGNLDDFQAKALQNRPDLRAAQQGVTAANSQHALQQAIGKRDITGEINYTHIGYLNDVSLFGQMQIPIFDRNQGEIARAAYAITQAQEQERFSNGQVLTDVRDAFENLRTNDQVVGLYRSGYLDQARQSRCSNSNSFAKL
jgi:cobalt-zinc-cadmium efflux system outer membrane protein